MVYSPCDGDIIPTNQIKDEVFRNEFFGRGISISPKSNEILSPVTGIIDSISKEKHSIVIDTAEGVKLWIYIGNDIVQLNGAFMKCFVKEKQHIKAGTILFDCDFYEMRERGYHMEVSITVKENKNIFEVIKIKEGTIYKQDPLAGILFHHR